MFYPFEKASKIVADKAEEVLGRPEVQKELSDAIEACVREEVGEEIRRRTKDYVCNYSSGIKDAVRKGVDAWLEAHRAEVQAQIDSAAEKAAVDETVYQEVARHQFARFLSDMAGQAVHKAMARKAKKAAKGAK